MPAPATARPGKVGFKLSLRGYDPLFDHRSLTDDLEGRRFNRAPEKSLMLMKPAGAVPHQGGVMMQPGDPSYELIRRWISQGVKLTSTPSASSRSTSSPRTPPSAASARSSSSRSSPPMPMARPPRRDREAFLESSNTEVATVERGTSSPRPGGESTMLARYEGRYAAST